MDQDDQVPIEPSLFKNKHGAWISVEGPCGLWSPGTIPVHKDINHTFLRPYRPLIESGDPNVGYVQHVVASLFGRDLRALCSLSIRRKKQTSRRDFVPMDFTVYPGISLGRVHHHPGGSSGFVHHYSIREATKGGLQAYAHVRTNSGPYRPRLAARLDPVCKKSGIAIAELGGIITIGDVFLNDWSSLDPCGIAVGRIPEAVYNRRRAVGSISNYPIVNNHPICHLRPSAQLLGRPNYLWQSYFLSQRRLDDQDLRDVLAFFGHGVHPGLNAMEKPDMAYNGKIEGTITGISLDFENSTLAPYTILNLLTAVLPGKLRNNTGMVAMAEFLPILSQDYSGREEIYRRYDEANYGNFQSRSDES